MHAQTTFVAVTATALSACSSEPPPSTSSAPSIVVSAGIPSPKPPTGDDHIGRLRSVLSKCDGVGFLEQWRRLSEAQRNALLDDEDPSLALQAQWEHDRPDGVAAFSKALEERIGIGSPAWWSDVLTRYTAHDNGVTSYKIRSPWTAGWQTMKFGEHEVRVRDTHHVNAVSSPAGIQEIEYTHGVHTVRFPSRLLQRDPESLHPWASHLEVLLVDRHAYVVPYDAGAGGFPLEVRRVDTQGMKTTWTAKACAAGRQSLGGLSITVLETIERDGRLYLFGAESHGVWLDVIDADDGTPLHHWSSDLWMARHPS